MALHKKEGSVHQPLSSAISPVSSRIQSRSFGCYHCKVSIVTLLLWNVLVGCGYQILVYGPFDIIMGKRVVAPTVAVSAALGAYGLLGIVKMLYPVGGLLADICCGRYKVIALSTFVIWCGYPLISIAELIYGMNGFKVIGDGIEVFAFVAFIIGFSGFRSNSVQFSLDQLQEASSEKISLFLHWFMWTEYVGEMVSRSLILISPFRKKEHLLKHCTYCYKYSMYASDVLGAQFIFP